VVTWGLGRAVLPAPAPRVGSELREWWLTGGPAQRAAVGGAGGLGLAVAAVVLHRPQPGVDGITDHIAVAVAFVQGGHTGPAVTLGLPVLVFSLWRCRARLVDVWPLLGVALVAAVGVGGVWYLRNWGQHSSPLWPFSSAAGGDPIPLGIQVADHTMLERFRQT